jgi:hypothetical protein
LGHIKYLGSGNFSDVYDLGNGKVFKAYKRKNISDSNTDQADNDAYTKAMFRAELKAYECIHLDINISAYFADFHGVADPYEVLSFVELCESKYVSGCGLIIEYIIGEESKMPHVADDIYKRVDEVLDCANDILSPLGLNPLDSSCINFGDGNFKIIDFGLWLDADVFYVDKLATNLKFSNSERESLDREFAT